MPTSTGSIFFLDSNSLQTLSEKAKAGDAESAFKIYQYYTFSNLDISLSNHWLEMAAKLGHPVAQYNLAVLFEQKDDKENATLWGKKAFLNGNAKAKRFVD